MGDNQSGGISKLLAAEHEATEIVNKARKGARSRVAAAPGAPPGASLPLAAGRHGVCAAAVALAACRPRRSCCVRDPEAAAVPSSGGHASRVALRSPAAAVPRRACVPPRASALPRHSTRSLAARRPRESQATASRVRTFLTLRPGRAPPAAKTARLRQAQEEAAAELATYRAQREEAFKKLVASVRSFCAFLARAAPAGSRAATRAANRGRGRDHEAAGGGQRAAQRQHGAERGILQGGGALRCSAALNNRGSRSLWRAAQVVDMLVGFATTV